MNDKAKYLIEVLDYAVALPYFQREGKITKCNLFTKSILSWQGARYLISDFRMLDFNHDITSMNPGAYLCQIMRNTDTRTEYANIDRMAKSGLQTAQTHDIMLPDELHNYPLEITEFQAQDYANQGAVVLAISAYLPPVGHEVIIRPDDEPYDEARGCKMTQAGWFNGTFYMRDIFGEIWRSPKSDIKYIIFPKEVV